jgi:hypothetical protein
MLHRSLSRRSIVPQTPFHSVVGFGHVQFNGPVSFPSLHLSSHCMECLICNQDIVGYKFALDKSALIL